MFGHDWNKAEATVIAVKDLSNWSGDPGSSYTQSRPHEYVVDVRPEDEPTFRATFRDPSIRGTLDHPNEGQVINVLYRPKSHDVKLIPDEWKYSSQQSKGANRADNERFEAAEHGSAGQPVAPAVGEASAGDQLTALRSRHDRGELTDAEYDAEMEKVWARELNLPPRS